jgi:hypothetical protein
VRSSMIAVWVGNIGRRHRRLRASDAAQSTAPSLRSKLLTCTLAVLSLVNTVRAISRLVRPAANSARPRLHVVIPHMTGTHLAVNIRKFVLSIARRVDRSVPSRRSRERPP